MKYQNSHIVWSFIILFMGVFCSGTLLASNTPMTDEEKEKWFNSNEDPVDPLKLINEGKLVFLKQPPKNDPHEAKHVITILPQSLKDGWVSLYQCHQNLDVMPKAQVVFMGKKVRNLKVISSLNIEKTWIEGDTIQLKNIGKDAELCLDVETKALKHNADGSYTLKTGPYQRKFLDGYFPMRLLLEINYPDVALVFEGTDPSTQPGLTVKNKNRTVNINALFEGQLHLGLHFNKE